jgi:enoyl-CoA hydratase
MGEIQVFGMWPIHLGMRKTKEWLFTGDSMSGVEAAELGLANWAVPADEVESVAMADFEHIQRASGVRKAVQDRGEPFSHHRSYWNAYLASKRGGG